MRESDQKVENMQHTNRDVARGPEGAVSRRTILAGGLAALTSGFVLGGPVSAASAAGSTLPRLPYEIGRRPNRVTRGKGTLYDAVLISLDGDRAWIYVPQTVTQTTPAPVVWFYHGAGSDHEALLGGFGAEADDAVDQGAIAICQNIGGNLYASQRAVDLQKAGYGYMSSTFNISTNILRATSGGGALAAHTYGAGIMKDVMGLYFVNAIYDVRRSYDSGGVTVIGPAYGYSTSAIDATNPANFPPSAWAKSRIKIVYATNDPFVPPKDHALPFRASASQQGTEVTLKQHAGGHKTPSWVRSDFSATVLRWAPAWMAEKKAGQR